MSGSIPEKTVKHWNSLPRINNLQVADTSLEISYVTTKRSLALGRFEFEIYAQRHF